MFEFRSISAQFRSISTRKSQFERISEYCTLLAATFHPSLDTQVLHNITPAVNTGDQELYSKQVHCQPYPRFFRDWRGKEGRFRNWKNKKATKS